MFCARCLAATIASKESALGADEKGVEAMRYRRIPAVVDAWQVGGSTDMPDWLKKEIGENVHEQTYMGKLHYYLIITREGTMRASAYDWIIRGVEGELYPCKPEIFRKTYERVVA